MQAALRRVLLAVESDLMTKGLRMYFGVGSRSTLVSTIIHLRRRKGCSAL